MIQNIILQEHNPLNYIAIMFVGTKGWLLGLLIKYHLIVNYWFSEWGGGELFPLKSRALIPSLDLIQSLLADITFTRIFFFLP